MEVKYGDILLNDSFEIFGTSDGDLANGDNREHQIGAIINADEGNFRKHPTLAARLSRKLDGVSDSREIVADVIDSAALDGWRIDNMDIQTEDDNIEVTIIESEKITDDTQSLV